MIESWMAVWNRPSEPGAEEAEPREAEWVMPPEPGADAPVGAFEVAAAEPGSARRTDRARGGRARATGGPRGPGWPTPTRSSGPRRSAS